MRPSKDRILEVSRPPCLGRVCLYAEERKKAYCGAAVMIDLVRDAMPGTVR